MRSYTMGAPSSATPGLLEADDVPIVVVGVHRLVLTHETKTETVLKRLAFVEVTLGI